MRICVPCFLHVGVAKAAGDLLDIDTFIDEEGCMGVSVVVDPNMRQAGKLGVFGVMFFDGSVAQALITAADPERGRPCVILLLAQFVLFEDYLEGNGEHEVSYGGFIFGRGLSVIAFQFLRDGAADVDHVAVNIAPAQGVDFTFAHTGISGNGKENII